MRVAGMFAGIGGLELGLSQAGHESSLLCEVNPAAQKVLESRFPGVKISSDIRVMQQLPKGIDLLTAGFPCQDLSPVGQTQGIRGSRSGLVEEVFRLLAKRRCPWVLIENVPFLLKLDRGRGMSYVTGKLEKLGYKWAYRVIDTRSFGLPQRRERLFILASLDEEPARYLLHGESPAASTRAEPELATGFYWTEGTRGLGWAVDAVPTIKGGSGLGIPSPPAIWFPDNTFGTPDIRDAERLQGFPKDWTKPAEATSRASFRWTLVGNAVSVPVARWIGKRLLGFSPRDPKLRTRQVTGDEKWASAGFGSPKEPRTSVELNAFPTSNGMKHLHEFLKFESKPLSIRAGTGFLTRLKKSGLDRPRAFDRALEEYLKQSSRMKSCATTE